MSILLDDQAVIDRVFEHIDNGTTDEGDQTWQEPVENYQSQSRFDAEMKLLRRLPTVFCPSAALEEVGSYVARTSLGTPIVAVRGEDGTVRAFRNACRHRGMPVAQGTGCTRAFVCGYHAWAYRLDGRLQYIPHEEGFPQVNKEEYGLVPLATEERGGLVFVTQDDPISEGALAELPDLIGDDQKIFETTDYTDDMNWKLNAESNMEGYHIKPTHKETFYPYGYDNLTLVETFGPSSRVIFPFRRLEKLRDVARETRVIDGLVTFTYSLFPNTLVAVLSNHTVVNISEPISPTTTRFVSYRLNNKGSGGEDLERVKKDASFVADFGTKEDQEVVRAIQAGLGSGANTHFTYGKYEKAIVHFHSTLTEMLKKQEA